MSLNRMMAMRTAIKAQRDAKAIWRNPRPLPQYPDAHRSLKLHRAA